MQIEQDGYSDIHDVDTNTLKDNDKLRVELKKVETEDEESVSSALSYDTFDPNPDTD